MLRNSKLLKGRDFGITCSTATNWIAKMIVGAMFLTMLNTLVTPTPSGCMWLERTVYPADIVAVPKPNTFRGTYPT
ncbi:hypothetical protein ACLK1T_17985 [Escherichia coli]